jgi:6-pyruvoyltetrahydropterin/6-carboxytetrahydropterin synthase
LFTISVETGFRASHQLTLPDGSKEPLHEHDWRVVAQAGSDKLNAMGLVMDFHHLRDLLDSVLSQFQDAALEQQPCFARNNTSAENVAEYVYESLEGRLPPGVRLEKIKVVEEPGCAAKFTKGRL